MKYSKYIKKVAEDLQTHDIMRHDEDLVSTLWIGDWVIIMLHITYIYIYIYIYIERERERELQMISIYAQESGSLQYDFV